MIKTVLFDTDGTLVDSTLPAMKRHQEVMKDMGLPTPTLAQLKKIWGGGWIKELNATAALMGWPEGAVERFTKTYKESYPRLIYQPMPGVAEAIHQLHKMGLKLGVISNRQTETLVKRLREVNINVDLFFHLQGHDDHEHRKPDPRAFAPIIERLAKENIAPEEVLYVGDIPNHDMAAALAHTPPLQFVAVTSGQHTTQDFLAAGLDKDHIISSVADLPTWIKKFS